MEGGNVFVPEDVSTCLVKASETDGLGPNVNKENENVDNGADSTQPNVEPEDMLEAEGLNSSGVDAGVSEAAPDNKSYKKSGQGRGDRLKNSKEQRGQLGQNAPTTISRNQSVSLSKSLSFPSKGILNNGSRRSTTEMKQLKSDTKGALPSKRTNLASKPSILPILALKSVSVDATANGTTSEAPESTTSVASQKKNDGSGFAFRLNERAEKRKEFYQKLEEKIQAKEVEKTNLQAKSKENQEAEIKQLRKSLTFKATPMPSFYKESGPPKVELKKIPTTRARSPKLGRRKPSASVAENSAEGSLPTRNSHSDLEPSKLNGVANGTEGPVASKKPVRKLISRLPSQKSTVPKSDAKAPGTKPKISDAEHDVVKTKVEIEENPEKGLMGTPQEAVDFCGQEKMGESCGEEGKGKVEGERMLPSLPSPEIIVSDEVLVEG